MLSVLADVLVNDYGPLIAALTAFFAAGAGLLRVLSKTRGVSAQVTEVHALVNSNLTAALQRVEQLTAALTAAGIAVPKSEPLPAVIAPSPLISVHTETVPPV